MIGPNVVIRNGVKVQNNISIYEGVEIEDDVFLGPSVVFTNVSNPRSFIMRKEEFKKKTLLQKKYSIGANSTIFCGNNKGAYGFVGTGTLVIGDVPDYALTIRNTSRQIGLISKSGNMLKFDRDGVAFYSATNEEHLLINNTVSKK